MTKLIECPYCHKKLGELELEVINAQGSINCPFCNNGFGYMIRHKKILYLW